MSEDKFDIVFRGDIVLGHKLPDVKLRLGQLFKIDAAKVDALFVGRAVPLKRDLDRETAEKYKAALTKAGAQVSIAPAGVTGAAPAAKPRPKPQLAPRPVTIESGKPKVRESGASAPGPTEPDSNNPGPGKPGAISLKDRLAAIAAEEAGADAKVAVEANPSGLSLVDYGASVSTQPTSLAAATVDTPAKPLVAKTPTPAPIPSASPGGLSLAPMAGDLLSDDEKPKPVVAKLAPPDFGLAKVGADLLTSAEKRPAVAPPKLALNFSVAETGADMIDPADKPPPLPTVELDPDFGLAPVGSQLGQLKKPPPPPAPDTSKLSLSKPK